MPVNAFQPYSADLERPGRRLRSPVARRRLSLMACTIGYTIVLLLYPTHSFESQRATRIKTIAHILLITILLGAIASILGNFATKYIFGQ